VQALGSAVDLGRFSTNATGLDPDDFLHTTNFLLSRWIIIAAIGGICALASLIFLKRHDGNLM